MKMRALLQLLFVLLMYTVESRLNQASSVRLNPPPNRQLDVGTAKVIVTDDAIIENECEITITMIMPHFADYTVGGLTDIDTLGKNLVQRSKRDKGAFSVANVTKAKVDVQRVSPIEMNQGLNHNQTKPKRKLAGTRKGNWSWNAVKFQAMINRCRMCSPDNSDRRYLQLQKEVDDNWFAYKYLRSIKQSSDWLDDATYLRIQANCETIHLDGTYDETNEEQKILFESMDDEDYSMYKLVDDP
jgi:hypothetical protein